MAFRSVACGASLQDTQRTFVRVELRERTEGNRPLIGDVADGSARDAGNVQVLRDFAQHCLERASAETLLGGVRGNVRELPEDDTAALRKVPREPKLREHAVDA